MLNTPAADLALTNLAYCSHNDFHGFAAYCSHADLHGFTAYWHQALPCLHRRFLCPLPIPLFFLGERVFNRRRRPRPPAPAVFGGIRKNDSPSPILELSNPMVSTGKDGRNVEMGRRPCCAKGVIRGAWSAWEDKILINYIKIHGEGKWTDLPQRAGSNF
ncbi:anthocyanin regulatory c1 protein [Quercus suber]|uniref:Anthocyanin regulatory c1 protein n=1 Tax=Quercus suber TaxID=58331 RepID=A0AAW0KCV5_QUESU